MKAASLILLWLTISLVAYSSSFPKPIKDVPQFNSIEDILRTIDPNILPHSPIEPTGGELQSTYIQVLTQKAGDIRNYIAGKYYEDLSDLSDINIIVLGLIIIPFESRDNTPGYISNEQAFDCMEWHQE